MSKLTLEHLLRDVRYAIRQLARSPLFTVVGALSLGVGITIAVTAFSMINAALFKPLPVRDPEQIVHLFTSGRDEFEPYQRSSYADIADYERTGVFSGVTGHLDLWVTMASNARGGRAVELTLVAPNYFDAIGIRLAEGRPFDQHGALPEIILSHHYRTTMFRPNQEVIGQQVLVDNVQLTVVGVAPAEFRGMHPGQTTAGWIPLPVLNMIHPGSLEWYSERDSRRWSVIGRLKPGVTREYAAAQLNKTAADLATTYPDAWREKTGRPRLVSLLSHRESIIKPDDTNMRMAFAAMTALVLIVLVLACTNVAGLLLARAVARRQEVAIRLTLGASRGRLMTQLLTEAVLLAMLGGALGFLGAQWVIQYASRTTFFSSVNLTPDWRVLAGTLAISFACAIVFGVTPAAQALRVNLKAGLSGHGVLSEKAGVRGRLMALQVCAACVLILLAFSAGRGIRARLYTDPGFDIDRLLVVELDIRGFRRDTTARRQYVQHAIDYLRSLPGVQNVTRTPHLPFTGWEGWTNMMQLAGRDEHTKVGYTIADSTYFQTMGIALLEGRFLEPADLRPGPNVVVVNRAFAEAYGSGVVGRTIPLNEQRQITIVGMVESVRHRLVNGQPTPFIYEAVRPEWRNYGQYLITRVQPDQMQSVVLEYTRTMRDRYPSRLPPRIETLNSRIEQYIAPQRLIANAAMGIGAIELALAALGLYSLLLYSLLSRSREIGLRMALGARPRHASYAVVREGLLYVSIGGLAGIVLCVPTAIWASKRFIGADLSDPAPFLLMLAAIVASTAAAVYIPARRASRVQPMEALRYE